LAIKNIVIAVLLTFCITAVLFTITPTRSTETANSTTPLSPTASSTATYDPWMDNNHDGKINVLDLIKVATGLGSSGDPALSVTMKHENQLFTYKIGQIKNLSYWYSPWLNLTGYTSFTVTIQNSGGGNTYVDYSVLTWCGDSSVAFNTFLMIHNPQSPYILNTIISLPMNTICLHNYIMYNVDNIVVEVYAIA
jgi:hypothetical protein